MLPINAQWSITGAVVLLISLLVATSNGDSPSAPGQGPLPGVTKSATLTAAGHGEPTTKPIVIIAPGAGSLNCSTLFWQTFVMTLPNSTAAEGAAKPGATTKNSDEHATTAKPGGGATTKSAEHGAEAAKSAEHATTAKPGGGATTKSAEHGADAAKSAEHATTAKPGGGATTKSAEHGADAAKSAEHATTAKPGGGATTKSAEHGADAAKSAEHATTAKPGSGATTKSAEHGAEAAKPAGGGDKPKWAAPVFNFTKTNCTVTTDKWTLDPKLLESATGLYHVTPGDLKVYLTESFVSFGKGFTATYNVSSKGLADATNVTMLWFSKIVSGTLNGSGGNLSSAVEQAKNLAFGEVQGTPGTSIKTAAQMSVDHAKELPTEHGPRGGGGDGGGASERKDEHAAAPAMAGAGVGRAATTKKAGAGGSSGGGVEKPAG